MKTFTLKLSSALTLCIMTSIACAIPSQAQQAHGIAAVVNDDVITTFDLRQRSLFMMATQGIEPTEESKRQVLSQAMRNLVDEKLQIQEAKKYEQNISKEAVERGVKKIISRNGISVEEFSGRLNSAGISMSTLQDQVRAEIAWQRIIGGLYGSRIRISDTQIDENLNRVSANANKPSFHIAEIYIEASPDIGGMTGAMQGAEAMIEQLGQGAPFQILARQFSSAPSAAKGGDIGWIREGELREELDTVIMKMEKGQVSKPIPVPGGVYVIALADTRTSSSETFYTLSQVNYQIKEQSELETAKTVIKQAKAVAKSCDTIAADVKDIEGIASNDMGEIKASDLTEDILNVLAATNVGELSKPIATPTALISVMVCKRDVRGSNIPSRDDIENRLLSQQEAQASRRHLRDLRRKATIVSR